MIAVEAEVEEVSETVVTDALEAAGRLAKIADIEALLAARKVRVLAAVICSKASNEREKEDTVDSHPIVASKSADSSLSSRRRGVSTDLSSAAFLESHWEA